MALWPKAKAIGGDDWPWRFMNYTSSSPMLIAKTFGKCLKVKICTSLSKILIFFNKYFILY